MSRLARARGRLAWRMGAVGTAAVTLVTLVGLSRLRFGRDGSQGQRRATPITSPMVLVASGPSSLAANDALGLAGVEVEASEHDDERAASLAVGALSLEDGRVTNDALDEFAERLSLRLAPLSEDLAEGDPSSAFERSIMAVTPTINAASTLASRRIAAPEKTRVFALSMSCPATPALRCVPLWSDAPRSPDDDRALFFVWPLAYAIVLRCGDPTRAEEALWKLRELLTTRTTRTTKVTDAGVAADPRRVSMVLSDRDFEGRQEVEPLRERAERVRALLAQGGASPSNMRAMSLLARPKDEGRLVPWLRLDPSLVVITPTLASLSQRSAFVDEVRAAAASSASSCEWVFTPGT